MSDDEPQYATGGYVGPDDGQVYWHPETGYIIPASALRKYTHLLDELNKRDDDEP